MQMINKDSLQNNVLIADTFNTKMHSFNFIEIRNGNKYENTDKNIGRELFIYCFLCSCFNYSLIEISFKINLPTSKAYVSCYTTWIVGPATWENAHLDMCAQWRLKSACADVSLAIRASDRNAQMRWAHMSEGTLLTCGLYVLYKQDTFSDISFV